MNTVITLIVVMVSLIYAYVKTYQIVHLNMFRWLYVSDISRKLYFVKGSETTKTNKNNPAVFQQKKQKSYIYFNDSRKSTQVAQDIKSPSHNEAGYKKIRKYSART